MIYVKLGALVVHPTSHQFLCPQILEALVEAEECWGEVPCWVTSGWDGVHHAGSLHYVGKAVDLRTWHFRSVSARDMAIANLRARLSPDYDLVLEKPGQTGEHLHVEYDLK